MKTLVVSKKKFRYAKRNHNRRVCKSKGCSNKVGKEHHLYCNECHKEIYGY